MKPDFHPSIQNLHPDSLRLLKSYISDEHNLLVRSNSKFFSLLGIYLTRKLMVKAAFYILVVAII